MSKYKVGDDCIWDHCSSIATCPCCEKDMKIAELEAALEESCMCGEFGPSETCPACKAHAAQEQP